jgi:hypothetical protein
MIKPFFTDVSALASSKHTAERNRNYVQQLYTLWNTLTGFRVSSLDGLQPIIENPVERYIRQVQNAKKVRDGEVIQLPEGFQDIQRVCQELKQVNLAIFRLNGDVVEFSADYHRKKVNKVHFFAGTPLQQKRLRYAESVVKLIKQQQDFYAEEMGNTHSFRWSPVPTGVRLNYYGGGVVPVVDEKWVVGGFESEAVFGREKQKHEPFGAFRIAISERGDDMILLEKGDSTPKDFKIIPGHYEFIGRYLAQKQQNIIEKVTEVFQ